MLGISEPHVSRHEAELGFVFRVFAQSHPASNDDTKNPVVADNMSWDPGLINH